jgi:hypothetical protein
MDRVNVIGFKQSSMGFAIRRRRHAMDVYQPPTRKFLAVVGRLPDARHFMAETELADGAVLLTGGYPEDDQSTCRVRLPAALKFQL